MMSVGVEITSYLDTESVVQNVGGQGTKGGGNIQFDDVSVS